MLSRLLLQNTGPMRTLDCNFASRLNLFTGENGLGKSFLLETIWWALTQSWAGEQAYPFRPPSDTPLSDVPATIHYELRHCNGSLKDITLAHTDAFEFRTQSWQRVDWQLLMNTSGVKSKEDRHNEALFRPASVVVYARVDGGFSIHDAYRLDLDRQSIETIKLKADEVFRGKKYDSKEVRHRNLEADDICNGLIRDWIDWQSRYPEIFQKFVASLKLLSEQTSEELVPGKPTRVRLGVSTEIPTLNLPYGNVPITFASAGMRRILSLAYILVWTWEEHRHNAALVQQASVRDLILIIDEVEAHLHPHWQRVILPALFEVMKLLAPDVGVQLMVATHSPMVMASVEPMFTPDQDALWNLDLERAEIHLLQDVWNRRGDANAWLTDLFELNEPRSIPAEKAIQEAEIVMENPQATRQDYMRLTRVLQAVMPSIDPFWIQWRSWAFSKNFLKKRVQT